MAETSLQENACVESDFLNLKKAKCEVFNGFNGMFMGYIKIELRILSIIGGVFH